MDKVQADIASVNARMVGAGCYCGIPGPCGEVVWTLLGVPVVREASGVKRTAKDLRMAPLRRVIARLKASGEGERGRQRRGQSGK